MLVCVSEFNLSSVLLLTGRNVISTCFLSICEHFYFLSSFQCK